MPLVRCLALLSLAAIAQAADRSGARVARLEWLSGCWVRETPTRTVEEQWMAPRGGMMIGMSRTVGKADGKTVEFEQVRIEERESVLVYTAKPSGQPEASFTSITLTDSIVVFEDPKHDFPQRVGYRLLPDGGIAAWIEGRPPKAAAGSPLRRVDFPYRRASCPEGASPAAK